MERFTVTLVAKTTRRDIELTVTMMKMVLKEQSGLRLVRKRKRNVQAKLLMFLIDSAMVSRRILIFLDI